MNLCIGEKLVSRNTRGSPSLRSDNERSLNRERPAQRNPKRSNHESDSCSSSPRRRSPSVSRCGTCKDRHRRANLDSSRTRSPSRIFNNTGVRNYSTESVQITSVQRSLNSAGRSSEVSSLAQGQERYVRTVLNMIRIEANYKNTSWVSTLWKLQLVLNITKQKTIQTSPLKILIGIEATTPVLRSLVRDVALESATPNRESMRELTRSRARQLLTDNMTKQDEVANRNRQHSNNDANATELDLPGSSFSTGPSTPSLNLNTEAGQAEAPGTEDEEAADNQVEDDQAAGRPF
ncbi:hypothetical protein ACJJTC_009643 [Scirpophaga incertulas]